jgi:hypothetical protein
MDRSQNRGNVEPECGVPVHDEGQSQYNSALNRSSTPLQLHFTIFEDLPRAVRQLRGLVTDSQDRALPYFRPLHGTTPIIYTMQSHESRRKDGRLQDRVAIITGGSNGIGQAIALAYAKEGALVVVADLESAGQTTTSTADQIVSEGGQALFHQTDVCDAASTNSLVARTVETYGRLDM